MPESIPGPGQQDPFDAWLDRFIAIRNAAPRYTGPDSDYPETTDGDDGDPGFGSYWTDAMFAVSDEIVVTALSLVETDPHDVASMSEQVENYQAFLDLLSQLDVLGEQAGFTEIDGVSDGFNRAIADIVARIAKSRLSPTNPDPMFNQDAIDTREGSSNFDADGALEVLMMDTINDEYYTYWIVRDPDHPNDLNQAAFWYDFDTDRTPDTFVEMDGNGNLYWDSNGDGHGDTFFINPWTLDWPGN